jgi:hypothetical protein
MMRGFPRIFDPDRPVKAKRQKPRRSPAVAREALTAQLSTPKPRKKRKAN